MRRLQLAATSCVVVGLTLTGCGSGQAAAEDEYVAPLDAYLDEIDGWWDEDTVDAKQAQAEELIAACMAEAGFEYYPVTDTDWQGKSMAGIGTLEFAEEFGYGYTLESDGPGTGTFYWPLPPEQSPAEQANRAYVESLSAAAEREYNTALLGVLMDPIEDPDTFDWEAADRGCIGRAQDQVNEPDATQPEFSEVRDAVNQVGQQVEEDPRVTDATRAWSGCMAEAGYPGLTAIIDAENLVNDLVNDFMIANFPQMDPEYDEIRASVPEVFAALQAEEIAVAVADATCREDVGYNLAYRDVNTEYQQAVVDQYRDELEAWVEVTREQQAARAAADS
jgi:hypothetical protein